MSKRKPLFPFLQMLITLSFLGLMLWIIPRSNRLASPSGRLIFTDYDPGLVLSSFDFSDRTRTNIPYNTINGDNNLGAQAFIDPDHTLVHACLGQNNPFFCSAPIIGIFYRPDLGYLETLKNLWNDNFINPALSSNNRYIAYLEATDTMYPSSPPYQVYLTDTDGSNLQNITPIACNPVFDLVWSPNKNRLAFSCEHNQQFTIFFYNADTGDLVDIQLNIDDEIRELVWSPDGTTLLFTALSRDIYTSKLYAVNADGFDPPALIADNLSGLLMPVWSNHSNRIAFSSRENATDQGEIYVVNNDASNFRHISQSPNFHDYSPVWSPDDNYLAFFSDEGLESYLVITEADGSNKQILTTNQTHSITDVPAPLLFWLPD